MEVAQFKGKALGWLEKKRIESVKDAMVVAQELLVKKLGGLTSDSSARKSADFEFFAQHFERPINKNKMDAVKVIEASTKPAGKTKNTVTKTAAASEEVEELMAA